MTENQAIKKIRDKSCNDRNFAIHCNDSCMYGENKCEFDMAVKALEEVQKYHSMENRLKEIYGECDGLLDVVINGLLKFENAPNKGETDKSRLLTNEDVDKWENYKTLGSVEEISAIINKQKKIKEIIEKRDYAFDGQEFGATYADLDNIIDEIKEVLKGDEIQIKLDLGPGFPIK